MARQRYTSVIVNGSDLSDNVIAQLQGPPAVTHVAFSNADRQAGQQLELPSSVRRLAIGTSPLRGNVYFEVPKGVTHLWIPSYFKSKLDRSNLPPCLTHVSLYSLGSFYKMIFDFIIAGTGASLQKSRG